jgi:hypothetical protein
MSKSNEYGYIPESPTQARGSNTGIFEVNDVTDLLLAEQWSGDFGKLELIETQTASSDSFVDFTSIQESTYNVHFMTLNITDLSSSAYLGTRFYESGVLETASVYQEAYFTINSAGSTSEIRSTARDRIIITQSNQSGTAPNLYIYFYNLGDSAKYSFVTSHSNGEKFPDSSYNTYFGSGVLPQTSTVDGIRIFPEAGNISGTLSLYGIAES